jgi:hypothetical protein
MPEVLRLMGEDALERMAAHLETPLLEVLDSGSGWQIASPFAKEDENLWSALLHDAFGTRSNAACNTFIHQLSNLCAQRRVQKGEAWAWTPNEAELIAAIQIVRSTKPENEAQACIAAQMVALHFTAMKLGAITADGLSTQDERTAATLARVAKSYASLARTMAQLQGKLQARTINQTYEIHKHEHVHFEGGVSDFGGQGQAATTEGNITYATGISQGRPALPSARPNNGATMSLPSSQGQASLQNAWWGQRLWRAFRQTQWQLSARRLDA